MARKVGKLAPRGKKPLRARAVVRETGDGLPIGDSPEKFETSEQSVSLPVAGDDTQYTVSPFRAMLADRERTIRSGEHVPTAKTRQGVVYAAGLGMFQKDIAKVMGITLDTLKNHYAEELNSAMLVMANDIQTNLYNIARDPKHKGTVQAGIFLLSKIGGELYKDKRSVELSGPDGQPLQIDQRTQTIDPTVLTPEQRDALREIVSSAMRLAAPSQAIEGPVVDGDFEERG